MNAAVEVLVVQGPQVAGIWLVLLALAAVALAGLAVPRGVRDPKQLGGWLLNAARQPRTEAARRAAEAAEADRYASEITVAAHRATLTAERRRGQWYDAQVGVDEAWNSYQSAESTLTRLSRAAAYAVPSTARTPAEYAAREQYLHRSATAACRRGDLAIGQLNDVLANRGSWDPRLHQVEQELVLARAAVTHRLATYRQASVAERAAWHAADIAGEALRVLREEMATANADACALRDRTPAKRRHAVRTVTAHARLATY